jgi:cellulose synthase/poly-beta-1,6-N-acetylglucosamine synthase-like glycosyltransferase
MYSFFLAVFMLLAFLVVYILGGYLILLNWLAARFGKPIGKRPQFKSVSILIAVYNGEAVIREKLRSVVNLNYPKHLLERLRKSRNATSVSRILDGLIQEEKARYRRKSVEEAITNYYDGLSKTELAEYEAWGRFALEQIKDFAR